MLKILITGGHLAPALAVIEEIKRRKKNVDIVFIGRKYALDSEKTVSLEYKELQRRKIPFIPLTAGRLTRVMTLKTLRNIFRIPLGFINAFFIISQQRPNIIFSFGGYLSLPIVFWGYIFGVKVYTHEQTIHPGLANRIIGMFSKKVFISFPEAKPFFNSKKTVLCGNPIRRSVFKATVKPFEVEKDRPVIYVTGGSLGSHSINMHVEKIITKLLQKYSVIHQVGDTREYQDYERLTEKKATMPKDLADRYFPVKHFFEDEIGYIYSVSDLVVGRSGANTFFELLSLKKPALFIPLPWSAGREQQKHAEIFARNQIGEIFHQVEPSDKLLRLIESMIDNIDSYRNNFQKLENKPYENVDKFLVDTIFNEA